MNIDIQSQEVPAGAVGDGAFSINQQSGGGPRGMPPGSIYLYVFEQPPTPEKGLAALHRTRERLWCGRPGCPRGSGARGRRDARTTNLAESRKSA